MIDLDTTLRDFYYYYNESKDQELNKINTNIDNSSQAKKEIELLDNISFGKYQDYHLYEITFKNKGGMVMPIIIQWNYLDGTQEIEYIHQYIWRQNENVVIKTFLKKKEVKSILLDPYKETADINESNNVWNQEAPMTRFNLFKSKQTEMFRRRPSGVLNPMQRAKFKN